MMFEYIYMNDTQVGYGKGKKYWTYKECSKSINALII